MAGIGDVLDLDRYPLDRPASARGRALAAECRAALDRDGLFNFQYRSGLRTPTDPNLDGVARLLDGRDPEVRSLALAAGTLNVFKGKNTVHRISPVIGPRERLIAVFSYYERPGVLFSEEERIGFYGRAG